MKRDRTKQYCTPTNLGPVLVIRGALLMSLILLVAFLSAAGENARAESSALDQYETIATSQPEKITEDCQVSRSFPNQIRRWCILISFYAGHNDLPPDLIAALIWQESGGDPEAYSHSGAVGLMQVMPRDGIAAHFICQNGPCFASRHHTYSFHRH